ncbi:hypothetical protein [Galactobacter valiniphilus]|uniref:hypothetical protein n=1 Tax=Galactobacter valiniphilus TaxID=2676122 RepID=UPI0037362DB1
MPEPGLFDVIPEGVFIAALTVLGGIIGALITAWATRGKGKSDAAQGLIDRFETRVTALEAKVTALETERDQARAERDTANRRADDADDTLRDRNELVDDYVDHAAELLSWASAGAPPPPPVPSWRIRNHLADLAANAETLRNQQKEG